MEALEDIQKDRLLRNYVLIDTYRFTDSIYILKLSQREKHSRESLFQRGKDLTSLSDKYPDVIYTGFDIGETKVLLPFLTHERFSAPILTKTGIDLYRLAFLYYKLGLTRDAIDAFEKCIDQNIFPDTSNLILSNLYSFSLKPKKAFIHAKEAVSINPEYAHAYYNLGALYEELGDISGALPAYLKAEKLTPTDDWVLVQIASVYYLKQNFKKSEEYISKTLKQNPFNTRALVIQNLLEQLKQ